MSFIFVGSPSKELEEAILARKNKIHAIAEVPKNNSKKIQVDGSWGYVGIPMGFTLSKIESSSNPWYEQDRGRCEWAVYLKSNSLGETFKFHSTNEDAGFKSLEQNPIQLRLSLDMEYNNAESLSALQHATIVAFKM